MADLDRHRLPLPVKESPEGILRHKGVIPGHHRHQLRPSRKSPLRLIEPPRFDINGMEQHRRNGQALCGRQPGQRLRLRQHKIRQRITDFGLCPCCEMPEQVIIQRKGAGNPVVLEVL